METTKNFWTVTRKMVAPEKAASKMMKNRMSELRTAIRSYDL